jgi:hypothetical protein
MGRELFFPCFDSRSLSCSLFFRNIGQLRLHPDVIVLGTPKQVIEQGRDAPCDFLNTADDRRSEVDDLGASEVPTHQYPFRPTHSSRVNDFE